MTMSFLCEQIWSLTTGALQTTLRGHTSVINDLSISCDDSAVASASEDCIVRVWGLQVWGLQVWGLQVNVSSINSR